MNKNYAIIVAAGKGSRMKADINKQFINIKDKPILYYTLKAFDNHKDIEAIILVAAKNEIEYCKENIVDKYGIKKVITIVEGGKNRQESVFNGLKAVENCDIILIHDGARPFVSKKIISDGINYAKIYGACACGVKPKDTIKVKSNDGFSIETLDRNRLINIQTPQCFKYELIYSCHSNIIRKHIESTDDTTVVEYFGHRVYIYNGEYENIKITTPEDLFLATKLIDNR
ncbi:2-C-methyl-D-erythritol 4-phosphate cytidylyltransferase [Clostridium rectalis]|uniref:2-C-methyl-D-erythritol 4-phosphate cytidylyltransferase n=1 Tax=Clostridium rectalis TaxID=2040295 RepID=UPI000F62CC37|nr:2-C-methyl-D-erythritol 4-phosphate cytidylyltransferase [Clostridium rectalis]